MLKQNRYVVESLRDALLERDELVGPEIMTVILAARPELHPATKRIGELRPAD